MRRGVKRTSERIPSSPLPQAVLKQEPQQVFSETGTPSHAHITEHLLETKRQQVYAEYQRLCQTKGWSLAEEVATCEKAFASSCRTAHAMLFCTESAALQVLLEALALSSYDRLYLPENLAYPLYFVASKTPARIHAVAVDPVNRGIDLESLASMLHKHATRGRDIIIVSHIAGSCFPLADLEQLICAPNTVIIEDATEAFGAKEPTGSPLGSSHHSMATLWGFSPGAFLDAGGGGAITTQDKQLDALLRASCPYGKAGSSQTSACQHEGRFSLSLPQMALLHAQLQTAHIQDALKARQDAVTRYMAALQEAFLGIPKDRQPQLAPSLADPHAAPSALLLRVDCVQLGARKERIIALFHKAGLSADFGTTWDGKKKEEERPLFSCFTSLRIALKLSLSHIELLHLFKALREILLHP